MFKQLMINLMKALLLTLALFSMALVALAFIVFIAWIISFNPPVLLPIVAFIVVFIGAFAFVRKEL